MPLFWYQTGGRTLVSDRPDLPLPSAAPGTASAWLFDRDPRNGRACFCASDPRQLTAGREDVAFLSPDRIDAPEPPLTPDLRAQLEARTLTAVNVRHPRWERALSLAQTAPGRKRVHLLAVGDVGGTLLTALKLLGGDCLSAVGICDLQENTVRRWVAEMEQVSWPWNYDALPKVEAVDAAHLFDCDVFVFAASRGVPPVGSGVADVRMAQFAANRTLIEHAARQARETDFAGTFLVLSDPVDPLCKAAFLASNQDRDGVWDGRGLLAEQIRGLGLGVMNARAAALARKQPEYRRFLDEGRTFGPHGEGLIAADSVTRYNDGVSRALTRQVVEANLLIRELGFKPYVAPALSSGALQLLLMLRGQWHCGSVCLGDVWFGCRSRRAGCGLETEALALPDDLFARLRESEERLRAIC